MRFKRRRIRIGDQRGVLAGKWRIWAGVGLCVRGACDGGLAETKLRGAGRFGKLGESMLGYDEVLRAGDPAAMVLRFLEEMYSAAADAAEWDRAALGRTDAVVSVLG